MALDPTIGIIATIFMLAFYGVMRYAQQTFGNNPETWNIKKFGLLLVVGVIVALGSWYITGAATVPDEAMMAMILQYIEPIFATLGISLTAILGGRYVKNVSATGALKAPVATSVAPTSPLQHLGFTVTPAFLSGKSPFVAVLNMKCSTIVKQYVIDWTDGSAPEHGTFTIQGEYAVATVYHAYTFQYDGKYSSHSYYPVFTVISADGVSNTFNTEQTGRCCSVEVQS